MDNNIDFFDNLLFAYLSDESNEHVLEKNINKEMKIVFGKKYKDKLSKAKLNKLISSLTNVLSKDTLGSIVQENITATNFTFEEIHHATGMSASLLENIKEDLIFANSIPIRSLAKLLKLLNIPLKKAISAINLTFEKLIVENKMLSTFPVNVQPIFRRSIEDVHSDLNTEIKSNASHLYQNKESLQQYIERLSELFDEEL